ncbi:hypothetical protein [Burkholderia oklahomensis]|uniref:hypothetical protein n=1 Tax=Burkholderia oklahomensis TaxID=342113 RepID=UPI000A85FD45|nr:hypothetical protein [Burkholderia oklahomensis]QPS39292.1 hypothetical protein I6G57_09900 [Burkholderia oklahomensis]
MGITRACGLVGISRSLFHYESRRRIDDEVLTSRMGFESEGFAHRYLHKRLMGGPRGDVADQSRE